MLFPRSPFRRTWTLGPLLLLGSTLLFRCSSTSNMGEGSGGAMSGQPGGGSGNRMNTAVDIGAAGSKGEVPSEELDPLCGTGSCIPDDASGCSLEPMTDTGGTSGLAGAPGYAGMAGAGGLAGAGPIWEGMAGLSANPGDLGMSTASCLVSPVGERACAVAGAKAEGEPCLTATGCGAGLACVGEGETGVCRQYCCRGTEASCSATTYCTERPLLGNSQAKVPVCVPADNCSLLEPYPCPEGQECTCQDDLACVVVRADGKTACTRPGSLQAGEPCDPTIASQCGHGLVCSAELGCLAICSTVATVTVCMEGQLCQTPPGFPSELGVCVGDGSPP